MSRLACLLTTSLRDAPLYRLALPTAESTGLRQASQVMVDKIVAVRRDRCGPLVGRSGPGVLARLRELLAFVTGLAD